MTSNIVNAFTSNIGNAYTGNIGNAYTGNIGNAYTGNIGNAYTGNIGNAYKIGCISQKTNDMKVCLQHRLRAFLSIHNQSYWYF